MVMLLQIVVAPPGGQKGCGQTCMNIKISTVTSKHGNGQERSDDATPTSSLSTAMVKIEKRL